MKSSQIYATLLLSATLLCQCSNEDPQGSGGNSINTDEWLIPVSQVLDGGPGKDGIPSIDNPQFISASSSNSVAENELVIIFKNGNDVFFYPHDILDWHEIVNHFDGNLDLTVTYCPLTGTAIGWNPSVNGKRTEFGVSGLLYNSNLMPYDRNTNSTWSQMRLDCVNGEQIGISIQTMPLVETNFKTAKAMFPNAQVLSRNTGFSRNYGVYPYGSYKTSNQLIFPIDESDETLHLKERVLGVQHNRSTTVFTFNSFENGSQTTAITNDIGGESIVMIGSKTHNFMVAFVSTLNNKSLTLEGIELVDEAIAKDGDDNYYNVFGEVIQGPDIGSNLTPVVNYIGYWFAWIEFNPNLDLID